MLIWSYFCSKPEKLKPGEVRLHFQMFWSLSREKRAGEGKHYFQKQLFQQLAVCIIVSVTGAASPPELSSLSLSLLLPVSPKLF